MDKPPFRIVIAYEDFDTGLRAKEMLARLSNELNPEFEVQRDVWKFELLGHSPLRKQAALEASAADMILIAARAETELPEHVKSWIEEWAAQRDGRVAALVALLDQEEAEPVLPGQAPALCAFLQQTAEAAGMDFFCKTGNWQQQDFEYVFFETTHHPAAPKPQILEEVLYQEGSRREWGIND
jgi:hypothetical protein